MSKQLEYLEGTGDRLMVWLMDHDTREEEVHEMVSQAYGRVRKACEWIRDNEGEEGEGDKRGREG